MKKAKREDLIAASVALGLLTAMRKRQGGYEVVLFLGDIVYVVKDHFDNLKDAKAFLRRSMEMFDESPIESQQKVMDAFVDALGAACSEATAPVAAG